MLHPAREAKATERRKTKIDALVLVRFSLLLRSHVPASLSPEKTKNESDVPVLKALRSISRWRTTTC